ncbi:tetratricopeptide repeat protein [Geobacter sp. DSM 9736]|uniref:tetratricopeptide repeat protein n=1 Tax=Geobacter sp. DSM 9736 TaxID=1277350 RepID=UPI000B5093A8|nr:tetratricopeptide repeat protein [Geobacter sp. DSM 9736]SNB46716.1 Tetratricopeptide repeat-containing protein [Geobacter sp. DSM 9736]
MSSKAAVEFFNKGRDALYHDHTYLARVCLENAVNEERKPAYCSYLAVALAKSRGDFDGALTLAQEALRAEPANSLHYLNLGRIFVAAGQREEAIDAFRTGARLDRNPEILQELEILGTRRKPVIRWLAREHPVNKLLGKLLACLGLSPNAGSTES